jgi:hypothetical protein
MDVIKAEILITQDLHLQPILGTKFYDTLLSKITSTGNTLNADETTLVNDYIAPFLIQKSYAEIIPFLWSRSMNRGIVSGEMENATSVDVETMKYLRGIQVQRADFYRQRLLDYLIVGNGQNKFPDYVSQSTMDGMTPIKNQKYSGGIVLNHTTRRGYNLKGSGIESYSENEHINKGTNCCD